MDTARGNSCNELQRELETARDTLIVLNDSIKRIVGRSKHVKDSRSDTNNPHEGKQSEMDGLKNNVLEPSLHKRGNGCKSVFNRLSSPSARHIGELKPRLTSRVIRELPSRQEIVNAQCVDSESRARNRRIFGSLLGTLHKFCQEESRLKQKEEKKAQIEKKLEEQEQHERESLKKERQSLFYYRKRKQLQIKNLEQKIGRVKDFEAWEASINSLKPFIKTKSNPSIYFKPKILNKKTEQLLVECDAALSKLTCDRRDDLNHELSELEETFKIADFDMKEINSPERSNLLGNMHCSSTSNRVICSSYRRLGKDVVDFKENTFSNISVPAISSDIVENTDGSKDQLEQ